MTRSFTLSLSTILVLSLLCVTGCSKKNDSNTTPAAKPPMTPGLYSITADNGNTPSMPVADVVYSFYADWTFQINSTPDNINDAGTYKYNATTTVLTASGANDKIWLSGPATFTTTSITIQNTNGHTYVLGLALAFH